MHEILDLKDRKLLFELEHDSRQSLQQIGHSVGLSKEAVFYRMKNLESKGIIKNYLSRIALYDLGFSIYSVLLKFRNMGPSAENAVFSFLSKQPEVSWLATCEGAWDTNFTLITKNHAELEAFMTLLSSVHGTRIAQKQLAIMTRLQYYRRTFSIDRPREPIIMQLTSHPPVIDPSDLKLLRIISHQARMPLVDVAQQISMHPKTIASTIRRLEREGIIQGHTIQVDFSQLGLKSYKVWFSLQGMTNELWTTLFAFAGSLPQVTWATRLIGTFDFSIELEVADVAEFRTILGQIKSRFSKNIAEHDSLLIFEELVLRYL
jgi:Lrp/AsnC family leucine-responsive transcriptional regulator